MRKAIQYHLFLAEDFAADPDFIEWVLNPDKIKTESWQSWLKKNPDKVQEVELAVQLIKLATPQYYHAKEGVREEVWDKILLKITTHAPYGLRPFYELAPIWRNVGRWAAVFAGVLFLAGMSYRLVEVQNTVKHVTGPGETKTVLLPDKSKVVLNANSSLSYSKNWDMKKDREVDLTGEAFFSVVHQNRDQRFLVRTKDASKVEVLGTRFTVISQKERTQVVLNQGKVHFDTGSKDPDIDMKPGESVEIVHLGLFTKDKVIKRNVNPDVYSSWVEKRFVFDNTTLSEIAGIIESSFGYKIEFASGEIGSKALTLDMPQRNLDVLLKTIAEIHDLTIERKGNHLLFSKKSNTN